MNGNRTTSSAATAVHFAALLASVGVVIGAGRGLGEVLAQGWLDLGFHRTVFTTLRDEALNRAVAMGIGGAAVAALVCVLRLVVPRSRRVLSLSLISDIALDKTVRLRALIFTLALGCVLMARSTSLLGNLRLVYTSAALSVVVFLSAAILVSAWVAGRVRDPRAASFSATFGAIYACGAGALVGALQQNIGGGLGLLQVENVCGNVGVAIGVVLAFIGLRSLARERRRFGTTLSWGPLLILLAAWGASSFLARPALVARNPKSVILIGIDTLRADYTNLEGVPANGRDLTPNMRRVAEGGVSFRSALSQAPWTMPAFASIFTGRYPREHGASHLLAWLDKRELALAEILAEAGYRTAGVISNNQIDAMRGFAQGYDVYDDDNVVGLEQHSGSGVTDRGLELIDEMADEPFFLFLHYFDPHYDYRESPDWPWADSYDGWLLGAQNNITNLREKRQLLSDREVQYLRDCYAEEVALTDREIGRVLDRLSELGLEDDVAVVIVGDHGEEFFEHGWLGHTISVHEEVMKVPLAMRLPGVPPAPPVDGVVETRLVFGTLLDYLELEPPGMPATASLLPLVRGDPNPDGEEPVAFGSALLAREKARSGKRIELYVVQQGKWKLIRDETRDLDFLFDLERDPREQTDLAEAEPGRRDALRERLKAWIEGLSGSKRTGKLGAEAVEALEATGYL